jgi:dynactin complex subunit
MWLFLIGKDNVCANCIARETVFKDIKYKDESRLKKALRVYKIESFEDLKKIEESQAEELEDMPEISKSTIKFKKVKPSVKIDSKDDSMDYLTEMDEGW